MCVCCVGVRVLFAGVYCCLVLLFVLRCSVAVAGGAGVLCSLCRVSQS